MGERGVMYEVVVVVVVGASPWEGRLLNGTTRCPGVSKGPSPPSPWSHQAPLLLPPNSLLPPAITLPPCHQAPPICHPSSCCPPAFHPALLHEEGDSTDPYLKIHPTPPTPPPALPRRRRATASTATWRSASAPWSAGGWASVRSTRSMLGRPRPLAPADECRLQGTQHPPACLLLKGGPPILPCL